MYILAFLKVNQKNLMLPEKKNLTKYINNSLMFKQ